MIIDYKINDKYKPSDRQVWLMSKNAQDDGCKLSLPIMRGLASGDLKYIDGKWYKLCRHCMDYLELSEFYPNSRYLMGTGYICKTCMATRRRIKQYGKPSYISDVGMNDVAEGVSIHLNDINKRIIREGVKDNESS